MTPQEEFVLANRAFDLFNLAERERTLERFALTRFTPVTVRFFDAVEFVISESRKAKSAQGQQR